ncbi:MAG TPA: galactose-1-phosphate uridylyltransferase [Clostridiales bacterium]|jgi:UDPglucose--hexose-1-phosphate uridylyltransferase|nr:galactose-1-phosphate uridylyltransferase [Clostridiales bacterium]
MKLIINKHTGRKLLRNNIRDKRMSDFAQEGDEDCPFCPGHQNMENCLRYEETKGGCWVTRSIDNKFPALLCDEDKHVNGEIDYGRHEVMIETCDHNKNFFDFSIEEYTCVVKMYKARFIELSKDEKVESVIIYKNHLKSAGASKRHSHSQILSMSFIPPELMNELKATISANDISEQSIVYENQNFIVFIPEDAFLSGEIIIRHKTSNRFETTADHEIVDMAEVLRYVFQKVEYVHGQIPFNIYIHSLPKHIENNDFRWHIHVIPRRGNFGGFELSTGLYINSLNTDEMLEKFKER